MDVLGIFSSWNSVTPALVLTVVLLFYWYHTINDNYWKRKEIPYVPRQSWIFLLHQLLTKNIHEMEIENYKKHGRVYGNFEFKKPTITVGDPELLRHVLVKDFQHFSKRRDFDAKLDPVVGNMVSVLNGEDWKRVRTIITPAFTSGKMRKMTKMINDCSQTVINSFIRSSRAGTPVDCKRAFGAFTMDVIASCAFGTKINSHDDPNNPFVVQAYNAFNKNSVLRVAAFFLIPQIFWKVLRLTFMDPGSMEFFTKVTLQLMEARKNGNQRGNDFMQLMMNAYKEELEENQQNTPVQTTNRVNGFTMNTVATNGNDIYEQNEINRQVFQAVYRNRSLSQDELLAQCILFFMVGYETTASTLSFMSYSLACNPEVQENLIKEIDEYVTGNEQLTYDIIKDMKYLDCVLSETLRMYPPLVRAERTAVADYKTNYRGLTIRKNMIVGIPIYAMHHDPEFFCEPEKFMPERFFPENISHPPYAYLPFGAGPRNCLGMRFALMEIKLCMANALRRVRFKTCSETKIPLDFGWSQGFLSPSGLKLMVDERTDVH